MLEQYKPAVKQGVIMTLVGLLIFFITYAIDPLFLAKPKGWIILIVVNLLALPIYFLIIGAKACKPNFEYYTFGKAFSATKAKGFIGQLQSTGSGLVWYAIIALIVGLVQRDKEPKLQSELNEIGK
jgi:hypothetical protein